MNTEQVVKGEGIEKAVREFMESGAKDMILPFPEYEFELGRRTDLAGNVFFFAWTPLARVTGYTDEGFSKMAVALFKGVLSHFKLMDGVLKDFHFGWDREIGKYRFRDFTVRPRTLGEDKVELFWNDLRVVWGLAVRIGMLVKGDESTVEQARRNLAMRFRIMVKQEGAGMLASLPEDIRMKVVES